MERDWTIWNFIVRKVRRIVFIESYRKIFLTLGIVKRIRIENFPFNIFHTYSRIRGRGSRPFFRTTISIPYFYMGKNLLFPNRGDNHIRKNYYSIPLTISSELYLRFRSQRVFDPNLDHTSILPLYPCVCSSDFGPSPHKSRRESNSRSSAIFSRETKYEAPDKSLRSIIVAWKKSVPSGIPSLSLSSTPPDPINHDPFSFLFLSLQSFDPPNFNLLLTFQSNQNFERLSNLYFLILSF